MKSKTFNETSIFFSVQLTQKEQSENNDKEKCKYLFVLIDKYARFVSNENLE